MLLFFVTIDVVVGVGVVVVIGATVVVTGLKRFNISKNFFSTFCKRERVQKKIVLGSAEVETTFFILIEKKVPDSSTVLNPVF